MSDAPVAIAPVERQMPALTNEDIAVLRATVLHGASEAQLRLFAVSCNRRNLDPFSKEVYGFVNRQGGVELVVSIDGLRKQAAASGEYMGQSQQEWCGADGVWHDIWLSNTPPLAARITVHRAGHESFTGVALWREYGRPGNTNWDRYPTVMLSKCFSDDTEVLTDRGFQRFAEVTGRVLQVTDSGLEPTDAQPFRQAYSGPMVVLCSDDLNFAVTPNHDMLTTEGKIEAGAMYAKARARPRFYIPRCLAGSHPEAPISDQQLRLAAAYLADGSDRSGGGFRIEVSRAAKVGELTELAGFASRHIRHVAGESARTAVRTITTRSDKHVFVYDRASVDWLCEPGKRVRGDRLLQLSRRQARLFVDALVFFDGTRTNSGTRRFYSSRIDHIEAFEVACVVGGYAVSPRRPRTSDISAKPNYILSISSRSEIPVVRWGAPYHNVDRSGAKRHTGLEVLPNESGEVWCVTVPSGVIVVRRHGFSMLCGNCAEASAIRHLFPNQTQGLLIAEEAPDRAYEAEARVAHEGSPAPHRAALGTPDGQVAAVRETARGAGIPASDADKEHLESWRHEVFGLKGQMAMSDPEFNRLRRERKLPLLERMSVEQCKELYQAMLDVGNGDATMPADVKGDAQEAQPELIDAEYAVSDPDRYTR